MEVKEKNSVLVELYDFTITEQKDDRFARVITTKTFSEDNLVDLAVIRGTDFSANTLKSALHILKELAIEQIVNGASVQFGLGHFKLNVNGVFIGDNAKWDKAKHSLRVHVTPSAELRRAVKSCDVDVRGMAASPMAINSLTDVSTGETNACLTPGGGVNVVGTRIKVEGDEAGVGVKLVNEETKAETQIPINTILTNTPSKLTFIVPASLAQGDYKLIVTTQYSSSGIQLKEARNILLDYVLEVR